MLALVLSPLGRWLCAAVVSLGLIGAAYIKGRMDRAALDQSAALRATVASLTDQLRQTQAVAESAAARADAREIETTVLNQRVADYEAHLAQRKDCGCTLGPDDLRRLRDIIGPGTPLPPRRP